MHRVSSSLHDFRPRAIFFTGKGNDRSLAQSIYYQTRALLDPCLFEGPAAILVSLIDVHWLTKPCTSLVFRSVCNWMKRAKVPIITNKTESSLFRRGARSSSRPLVPLTLLVVFVPQVQHKSGDSWLFHGHRQAFVALEDRAGNGPHLHTNRLWGLKWNIICPNIFRVGKDSNWQTSWTLPKIKSKFGFRIAERRTNGLKKLYLNNSVATCLSTLCPDDLTLTVQLALIQSNSLIQKRFKNQLSSVTLKLYRERLWPKTCFELIHRYRNSCHMNNLSPL